MTAPRTTLLVDIGNTRVKWTHLRGASPLGVKLGRMQAAAHENSGLALRALVRGAPRDVNRVIVVSVVDEALSRVLDAAVRRRFGVVPEYIRSQRRARGVTNGYRDIWRLGADRWVSAVGAHSLARGRTAVIANVGTALTIDAVTAAGRHRGGAIVPGPATMVASLLSGTHGIRRRANGSKGSSRALFATDTASALAAGSMFAAAALIDRALLEARALGGGRPLLLLTGGGAPALRRYLKNPARVVPDLVLRGLAEFAKELGAKD